MSSNNSQPKLSDVLPPLIFGTATFTYQFNVDPYALNPNTIVERALAQGIRAFDTSPYYGPAEAILGTALNTSTIRRFYQREDYTLLTKVGRIASDVFDYSPAWIRHSVRRSCRRLHTRYLDVVYCHDVEFVTPHEVLTAVRELRRIRDEDRTLKYVGICGYPVDTLTELAAFILRETGEPLDIVQSYANFTLQNQRLLTDGLDKLVDAQVDVVTNASPLGMGLLRRQGVPIGAMGNWHPAPDELRTACLQASQWVEAAQSERLEIVAVRFAMESWLREGQRVGACGHLPGGATGHYGSLTPRQRLGVSVIGVSKVEELDETMRVWRSVIDGLADDLDTEPGAMTPEGDTVSDHEWSLRRRQRIRVLAKEIRQVIGQEWADFAWHSPEEGFVNQRKVFGVSPAEEEELFRDTNDKKREKGKRRKSSNARQAMEAMPDDSSEMPSPVNNAMLTPPSEPEDDTAMEDVPPLGV